jgi:hypothetical protein
MGAGGETPRIREIQILSDEESRFFLGCYPNFLVHMTSETLLLRRMDVMTEIVQQV